MYYADYQMSLSLLVVPYAPLKALKSNDFRAFLFNIPGVPPNNNYIPNLDVSTSFRFFFLYPQSDN